MSFKMIDANKREREPIGQPFGVIESDQKRTGEAWSLCDGDGTKVKPGEMGLGQRGLDNSVNGTQMSACGQLRHHAAELAMYRVLRRHDV